MFTLASFDYLKSLLVHKRHYFIEKCIPSAASAVFFVYDEPTQMSFCVKMWLDCDDKLYNAADPGARVEHLLEGLKHNRVWAPGVCLGIAKIDLFNKDGKKLLTSDVKKKDPETIVLGPLIETPLERELDAKQQDYALIMVRLAKQWELREQLLYRLGTQEGIEFLAQELARMHKHLKEAPKGGGIFQILKQKLEYNLSKFREAIHKAGLQDNGDKQCEQIENLLKGFLEKYEEHFIWRERAIMRCHGDLKLTNLWVRPAGEETLHSTESFGELLALDCIDFNPSFYYIDILSDIAMLAVDLEVHLARFVGVRDNGLRAQALVDHFMKTYIEHTPTLANTQQMDHRPFLEYYMTEKAIVCMYMSVLYDHKPELGNDYLACAHRHTARLHILAQTQHTYSK